MSEVNSVDYWDTRFRTDWTERRGCEQSRFFADVALGLMPAWLVRVLRDGCHICDFGCAMGDGTAALARTLHGAKVTGIDFSAPAIEYATKTHGGASFACRDLLHEPAALDFDVVFSSNVLEHFAAPREVLTKLAAHARTLMVHLVPFREPLQGREPEHLAAFDWQDIAVTPLAGWRLLHAASVVTATMPNSLWHGEQLLLVYARDEFAARLALTLAEVRQDSAAAAAHTDQLVANRTRELQAQLQPALQSQQQLTQTHQALVAAHQALVSSHQALATAHGNAEAQLQSLTAANAESSRLLRSMAEQVAAERAEVTRLSNELRAARGELLASQQHLHAMQVDLDTIRSSKIWRWTSPLRRRTGATNPAPGRSTT